METIKWKNKPTYFVGRNGHFKCIGLIIANVYDKIVLLPITSKGKEGRAMLVIPKEEIPGFIDSIKKAAEK